MTSNLLIEFHHGYKRYSGLEKQITKIVNKHTALNWRIE
jgi:hypothetical protein